MPNAPGGLNGAAYAKAVQKFQNDKLWWSYFWRCQVIEKNGLGAKYKMMVKVVVAFV